MNIRIAGNEKAILTYSRPIEETLETSNMEKIVTALKWTKKNYDRVCTIGKYHLYFDTLSEWENEIATLRTYEDQNNYNNYDMEKISWSKARKKILQYAEAEGCL